MHPDVLRGYPNAVNLALRKLRSTDRKLASAIYRRLSAVTVPAVEHAQARLNRLLRARMWK